MRKGRRARLRAMSMALLVPTLTIACNAILGNEERQVDQRGDRDAKPPATDGGSGDSPADDGPEVTTDADVPDDGAPAATIVVKNAWKTLNGASYVIVDGGVTITGFTSPAGHPMIVPDPMPAIPADSYTVEAVIYAPSNGEWGLMARVAADGSGALFGSNYGTSQRPFTGTMGPPDFNPSQQNLGPQYVYIPKARYRMRLKVEGTQTFGKMWEVGKAEPPGYQVLGTATNATTRGVGFYVYATYDAVLESMTITVP